MTTTAQQTCPKCNGRLTFKVEDPTIFNSQQVSVIALAQKPARCGECGREFVLTVGSAAITFSGMLEVVPPSPIIVPPGAGEISKPV